MVPAAATLLAVAVAQAVAVADVLVADVAVVTRRRKGRVPLRLTTLPELQMLLPPLRP
jgi:hypothetical protein